ncbi:hypothetical protein MNBD_IGNAVI01-527, partial [hydrothermal vent metagenome]
MNEKVLQKGKIGSLIVILITS